jgi:hypothetical protein
MRAFCFAGMRLSRLTDIAVESDLLHGLEQSALRLLKHIVHRNGVANPKRAATCLI